MSVFHPESLRPSTLRTLARALQKAAPDILATPCALNQAQELLARTLGHSNWHAAITRAEQGPPPPEPRPTPLTDPAGLTLMLFRTLALHMESKHSLGALRSLQEEALALSPLLRPLADVLGELTQQLNTGDIQGVQAWLTDRLMGVDRLLAAQFYANSGNGAFQEAINRVAHFAPPPPADWLIEPSVPLGVSLMEWRALWMRLREALEAKVNVAQALKQAHTVAAHPQWGQPAEGALYQEWLDHLNQGQCLTEAVTPALQRLAAHSPYVAWATYMAIRSEKQATLTYGLVQLDTARWLG
jgi:hypothetical protein